MSEIHNIIMYEENKLKKKDKIKIFMQKST